MSEIRFCEVAELTFGGKKIHCQYIFPHAQWVLWAKMLLLHHPFPSWVFYPYKYLCRNVRACLFIFIYILRICTYTHTSTHARMYTYIQRDRASRHSKSQEQASLLFFTAHQYSTAQEGQACTGGSHFPRHSRPLRRSPSSLQHPRVTRELLWDGWHSTGRWLVFQRKMKNKAALSQIAIRPHPETASFVI